MQGLIYYNIGMKCLVRLAVSISTLVNHFADQITILADDDGFSECEKIAKHFCVNIMKANFTHIDGKNIPFLNKCRLDVKTPYDKTIFLDSDTIVLNNFYEVFKMLDDHEFIVTQMCKWMSNKGPYRKRIEGWKNHINREIFEHAFDEPKAVNIGFYAWRKGAKIFDNWLYTAMKNQESFIPDEIACQILLPHVPHLVIGSEYNTSCKHEELTENSKTLHFHGRKHCRIDEKGNYLYHADSWYRQFDKIKEWPFIKDNIKYDAQLRRNLPIHERM